MAARLVKRNSEKKKEEKPTKRIEEVKIGDEVIVNNLKFVVYKIDILDDQYCLVDKYACDYYVKKGNKVEIVNESEKKE